jgi:putative DNA primase/helicase
MSETWIDKHPPPAVPPPPTSREQVPDVPPPPTDPADIKMLRSRKEDAKSSVPPQPPTPPAQLQRKKALVALVAGELPRALDEAEAALVAAGFPVLALDTVLVCPRRVKRPAEKDRAVETTRLIPVTPGQLQRWLGQAAHFIKFDKRANGYLPSDPPPAFVKAMLESAASWRSFPNVLSLVSCPFMRPDGSICATAGYDAASQLFVVLDPDLQMPEIPAVPTREQARAALELLSGLLAEFEFVSDTDRTVALAWLMTPPLRPAMDVSPLMLFNANVSGSGKSYLVSIGSAIASGQRTAAVISAGDTQAETEKRLHGLLLEGAPHVAVDNVDTDIEGTSIWCQVSEQARIRLRILCTNRVPEVENRAYLTVTGNHVRAKGDLLRRTLTCSLNVAVERPEKRKFKQKPVHMVLQNRGAYLAAIFMIARFYQAASCPEMGNDQWESYDDFVRLVRNPLRYLTNGKLDPCRSIDTARELDPTTLAILEFFDHWDKHMKTYEPAGAYEVFSVASERDSQLDEWRHPEFRDLLMRVATGSRSGKLSLLDMAAPTILKIPGRGDVNGKGSLFTPLGGGKFRLGQQEISTRPHGTLPYRLWVCVRCDRDCRFLFLGDDGIWACRQDVLAEGSSGLLYASRVTSPLPGLHRILSLRRAIRAPPKPFGPLPLCKRRGRDWRRVVEIRRREAALLAALGGVVGSLDDGTRRSRHDPQLTGGGLLDQQGRPHARRRRGRGSGRAECDDR